MEDSRAAFAVLLQEGYVYAREQTGGGAGAPPGRVGVDAILAAIHEIVYRQVRAGETRRLPRMLEAIANVYLTPFLGVEEVRAFIQAQREDGGPAAGGSGRTSARGKRPGKRR